MNTPSYNTGRFPDCARRIAGGGPDDRILPRAFQNFVGPPSGLPSRVGTRCRGASRLFLQELGAIAHNLARGAQLQILTCPDRLPVGLVRRRFSLSAEPGEFPTSTIHELRYAFAHASAPAKRPPFLRC
jgi:hypothetical protein